MPSPEKVEISLIEKKKLEFMNYLRRESRCNIPLDVLYEIFNNIYFHASLSNRKNQKFSVKDYKHTMVNLDKYGNILRQLVSRKVVSTNELPSSTPNRPRYYYWINPVFYKKVEEYFTSLNHESINKNSDFSKIFIDNADVVWPLIGPVIKYVTQYYSRKLFNQLIKSMLREYKEEFKAFEKATGIPPSQFKAVLYWSGIIKPRGFMQVVKVSMKFKDIKARWEELHPVKEILPPVKPKTKRESPKKIVFEDLKKGVDYFKVLKDNAILSWPFLNHLFKDRFGIHDSDVFMRNVNKIPLTFTTPFLEETRIKFKDIHKLLFLAKIVEKRSDKKVFGFDYVKVHKDKLKEIEEEFEKQEKAAAKTARDEKKSNKKPVPFTKYPTFSDPFLKPGGILQKNFSAFGRGMPLKIAKERAKNFAKDEKNSEIVEDYEDDFEDSFENIFQKLDDEGLLIKSGNPKNPMVKINYKKYLQERKNG